MGNWILYRDLVRDYEDIIMTPNSFAPTDKKLNYVIFKSIPNDDEEDEDSSEERERYLEKFYGRYNH